MILAMLEAGHLQVSHFTAAALYAFFASAVFGITFRSTPKDMLRYSAYCFLLFIGGLFVASWLMWLLHH